MNRMEEDSQLSQRAESVSARSYAPRDGNAHSGQTLCEQFHLLPFSWRGSPHLACLLRHTKSLDPDSQA
jgi:hypothetical protein